MLLGVTGIVLTETPGKELELVITEDVPAEVVTRILTKILNK
jgi:hypothetical protein